MDEVKARSAIALYDQIYGAVRELAALETHQQDRAISITIQGRKNGTFRDEKIYLLQSTNQTVNFREELTVLALHLHAKYLQVRINEAGRELAKLGFKKPAACK